MTRRSILTGTAVGLMLAAGSFLAGRMTGPVEAPREEARKEAAKAAASTDAPKVGAESKAAAPGGEKAAAVLENAESPSECVARLTKELKGSALEEALKAAAQFYAEKGLEAAKEFLLNMPPGEMSRRALLTVVYELRHTSGPELMAFLQENLSKLDRSHVEHGMKEILEVWLSKDFDAAARTTCGLAGWNAKEKASMLEAGVWMEIGERKLKGNPDALIDTLSDPAVRTHLAFEMLIMKLRMRANFSKVMEDFAAAPELVQINAAGKIPWELPLLPNPEEAMNVLMRSEFPAAVKMRDRSFQNWAASDLTHALEWLQAQPAKETRDQLIVSGWKSMAKSDPRTARTWVETISDENKRAEILATLETGK